MNRYDMYRTYKTKQMSSIKVITYDIDLLKKRKGLTDEDQLQHPNPQ